jgi:hypothetical protein
VDDETPSVEAAADATDVRALGLRLSEAGTGRSRHWLRWASAMLFIAAIVAAMSNGSGWRPLAVAGLIVGGVALGVAAGRPSRATAAAVWSGRYSITDAGLRRTNELVDTTVRWRAIERIEADRHRACVIFVGSGWVLPARCFDDADAFARFVDELRARHAAARLGPPDHLA